MPPTAPTAQHPAAVGTFSLDIYPSREDWSVVEDWMIAAAILGVLAWFALGGRRTYTGPRRYTAEEIARIEADVV